MNESTISVEDRKLIYRARRGLKELDVFLDPYVRGQFLTASDAEKQVFTRLIDQEDPDLLDWFMNVSRPADIELWDLIQKIKGYVG